MHPMLTTAVKAARRAGNIINRGARDLDLLTVTAKGPKDFVSEVDRAAEAAIVETLLATYPDHAILAEEGTAQGRECRTPSTCGSSTRSTARRISCTAFRSIACRSRSRTRRRHAGRDLRSGAQRPVHRVARTRRVPQRPPHPRLASAQHLRECLIGTGFPFRDGSYLDTYLAMMRAMITHTAGMRRPGAAALDLAYVAAGFYDGFWEVGLNPWDVAAGSLLVLEAGGLIGDLAGEGDYLHGGQVIAANPKIFAQMVDTLSPFRADMARDHCCRSPEIS